MSVPKRPFSFFKKVTGDNLRWKFSALKNLETFPLGFMGIGARFFGARESRAPPKGPRFGSWPPSFSEIPEGAQKGVFFGPLNIKAKGFFSNWLLKDGTGGR